MLLYAESHYPRRWPSLTRRAEPEIVADVPWRVEPGAPVPLLLTARDAHWYPVRLESLGLIARRADAPSGRPALMAEYPIGEAIAAPWWWRLVEVPPLPEPGDYLVAPVIRYTVGGRAREAVADNYRGTSHRPFLMRVAAQRWPVPSGWWPGDAHVHTAFTRDQIEFGPPLAAIAQMSRAMGLAWAALTDHSYDLDDSRESYLANDPALPRWHDLLAELPQDGACLIAGEEVSCGNARGRNVHLLAMGIREHIPGAGDSAERLLHTRPDLSIPEVIRRTRAQGGIAVAAHPGHTPPWRERVVFRRGAWEAADLATGLDGVQFWNGERDAGFHRGMAGWVQLLLSGKRTPALAGSDSHGAFGRSRQVRVPWLSIADDRRHLFGRTRTVVRADAPMEHPLVDALAAGRSYLTDGPALVIEAVAETDRRGIGDRVLGPVCAVAIHARSTAEWGAIDRIGIAVGIVGEAAERWRWRAPGGGYECEWEAPLVLPPGRDAYVRAEAYTRSTADAPGAMAFTNPIWISGGG